MVNLVIITDPGKALDDEEMLLVLSQLSKQGLANPLAVVTNLAPARLRAALARATLDMLGMPHVPVGIGSEVVSFEVQPERELTAIPYVRTGEDVVLFDGHTLLVNTLEAQPDKSVTLLLVSAMTDAARLLREREALFTAKIERVAIMGGVVADEAKVVLNAGGFMEPDSAVNNFYDVSASAYLYRRLQELAIPMVVLSRNAAYATKVPRTVYDDMHGSGHAVGEKLFEQYRNFVEDFWKAVNAPPSSQGHEALPARWNRDLFLETFCGGDGKDRTADDTIFDLVKCSAFSDPMALIAAIPELCATYYKPELITIGGATHSIVGVSRTRTCVPDSDALVAFMIAQVLTALKNDG